MKPTRAFTLIELMIVLVVVAILASIAYPTYRAQVMRARRSDAKASLLDLAARMERYYSENNTYATATIASGNGVTDVLSNAASPEGWYNLAITAQNATTFTVSATPQNAQASDDTQCATFTYTSTGVKGINGGSGTVEQCW